MPDHPLNAILVDGLQPNKAALRDELKRYARDFEDAATFNTYDLPGVTLAVIDGQLFLYDPLDLTSPDNGTTTILDASSRRFKRQSAAIAGSAIFRASAVAGTNSITFTTDGMPVASATRRLVLLYPVNTITGPATVAADGAAAVPLLSPTGNALATGEVVDDFPYLISMNNVDARIVASGIQV